MNYYFSSVLPSRFLSFSAMLSLNSLACAPLWAVLVGLLAMFTNIASADVGVYSPEDITVNRHDTLVPGMWSLGSDGCKLGMAGNLVVTPRSGSTPEGGEILDPFITGPQLCSWLSAMQRAHDSLRPAWDREHANRRKGVSRWNLLQRYWMWRKTFPGMEVDVEVRTLSLWNMDHFGHPLPWATVLFRYSCPNRETGYGLFDHLCGSVFSQGDDPRVPTEVNLLLNPRPGFNRPLDVRASNWQFVTGAISGLDSGREASEESSGGTFALLQSVFAKSSSFTTLRGTINDCWMYQGYCYFRWLLRMEWGIFGETFCERVHQQASGDVGSAVKSAALESVKVHVFALDLFSREFPVLYAMADEGVLGVNENTGLLTLQIDTNPANPPNFERWKKTVRNVRAANMLLKGVSSLFESRMGNQNRTDQNEKKYSR